MASTGRSGPTCHCTRCDARVVPVRTSPVWGCALVAGVVMVIVSVGTALFAGTLLMALAPVYLAIGMCIGPMVGFATQRPTCPKCGLAF